MPGLNALILLLPSATKERTLKFGPGRGGSSVKLGLAHTLVRLTSTDANLTPRPGEAGTKASGRLVGGSAGLFL